MITFNIYTCLIEGTIGKGIAEVRGFLYIYVKIPDCTLLLLWHLLLKASLGLSKKA
jgi:hypothetical protein